MDLHTSTMYLCLAVHDWLAFERTQLGGGPVELGCMLGRKTAFTKTVPAWPAVRVPCVESTDPSILVASSDLSAHLRVRRTQLLMGCLDAWRGWEIALAREIPALWPALAMPRFTLHTGPKAGVLTAYKLTFLQQRTNLGKRFDDSHTLPIATFADRVMDVINPLRALPKAKGLWAFGGPAHTGGSHNTYSLQGPVMAGAGPAEAAVCAAVLGRPYDVPFTDRGFVDRWLEQGWVALPSAYAKARIRAQGERLIAAMAAGVWNPPANGPASKEQP